EWQMRVDLAAAFRLAAEFNWHEAVANHFSLAVSPDGKTFLMNPRWRHFSRIRGSDLLLLDAEDDAAMAGPDAPDPSAWYIHGRIHRALPQARCILHLHSPYATAISALAEPEIKPIDQNTARYYNRVAYDMNYGGIADSAAEGDRLAAALGNGSTLMMGQHGILVVGKTVADAFDRLYYLERACQTLVLAYSTGQPLNIMSDDLAEATARDWEDYPDMAQAHFDELKQGLDIKDASYAT
ncbi:MAG TPA: class II aldolase/adducin family protein, partial [Aestuariivirgaceae bacterium]|nr:class II aldolase/adducin family protein [Aestuariivirgaceae bacterium]